MSYHNDPHEPRSFDAAALKPGGTVVRRLVHADGSILWTFRRHQLPRVVVALLVIPLGLVALNALYARQPGVTAIAGVCALAWSMESALCLRRATLWIRPTGCTVQHESVLLGIVAIPFLWTRIRHGKIAIAWVPGGHRQGRRLRISLRGRNDPPRWQGATVWTLRERAGSFMLVRKGWESMVAEAGQIAIQLRRDLDRVERSMT